MLLRNILKPVSGASTSVLAKRVSAVATRPVFCFGARLLATDSKSLVQAPEINESSRISADTLPNAPIRKFFEEQAVTLKPDGMPNTVPTGRPWFASELRRKSFEDLHKLHFVLLVERNKLLNEKIRHRKSNRILPSPERLLNVRRSMARLQTVLTERKKEGSMERFKQLADGMIVQKPPMSEEEAKWHKAHEANKKPAKHRPSAPPASGGLKTKRKMELAREFAEDTKDYVSALVARREAGGDSENEVNFKTLRPRWRNLAVTAQKDLKVKQRQTRDDKRRRAKEQSTRMKELLKEHQ